MEKYTLSPQLKEFALDSLSDIRCSYWIGSHPGKSYDRDVLVVRFEGVYRIGSAGNDDATFMVSLGNAGVDALDPDAIIIDLSRLNYKWGDMMDSVFGIGGERELPMALVVGVDCRYAIGTLCFGENSKTDACEKEWIFDSLDDAWQYTTKLLDDGETPPIHAAAKSEKYQRVKQLLDAGEDPNRRDSSGKTPLHEASDPAIVRLLIDSGADVKAKCRLGITALHLVKNIECARLLLEAGADPDARSWTDASPLRLAQSPEIARLLLDFGADIHQRPRSSLLHSIRRPDIAKIFIEAGADVNSIDENGCTALDCAEASFEQFAMQAKQYGFSNDAEVAQCFAEIALLLQSCGAKSGKQMRVERKPH